MPDNVIRIDLRRAIRFAHSFVCTGYELNAAIERARKEFGGG